MKRLVIIDGHAILHRAYHALPKENFRRNGQLVNAVYGFFSMLIAAISELKPDYLITCFDFPGPTFRQAKFIAYQANRAKTEEELSSQIDLARETIIEAEIPALMVSGFEADDLIGTIIEKVLTKGKLQLRKVDQVVVVTGDKDLMQLVNSRVNLFLLGRGVSGAEMVDADGVKKKLGIRPNQLIDYKALVGDPSDNYPGVSGVGPKIALDLLAKFSHLRKIYEHLPKISSELRKKLVAGEKSAFLSYDLAQINKEAQVKFSLKEAHWNREKLLRLQSSLKNLGFRSLVGRLEKKFSVKDSTGQIKLI